MHSLKNTKMVNNLIMQTINLQNYSLNGLSKNISKLMNNEDLGKHLKEVITNSIFNDFTINKTRTTPNINFSNLEKFGGLYSGYIQQEGSIYKNSNNAPLLWNYSSDRYPISSDLWDGASYTTTTAFRCKQRISCRNDYGYKIEWNDEMKESIIALEKEVAPNSFSNIFKTNDSDYVYSTFNKFVGILDGNSLDLRHVSFVKFLLKILLFQGAPNFASGGLNLVVGGSTVVTGAITTETYLPRSQDALGASFDCYACTLGELVNNGYPEGMTLIPIRKNSAYNKGRNNTCVIMHAQAPFWVHTWNSITSTVNTNVYTEWSDSTDMDGETGYFCFVIVDSDKVNSNMDVIAGNTSTINTATNNPWTGAAVNVTCANIVIGAESYDEMINTWFDYYGNERDLKFGMFISALTMVKFPLMKTQKYQYNSTTVTRNLALQDADRATTGDTFWGITENDVFNGVMPFEYINEWWSDALGNKVSTSGVKTNKGTPVSVYDIGDVNEQMELLCVRGMIKGIGGRKKEIPTRLKIDNSTYMLANVLAISFDTYRSITSKPLNVEIANPYDCGIPQEWIESIMPKFFDGIQKIVQELTGYDSHIMMRHEFGTYATANVKVKEFYNCTGLTGLLWDLKGHSYIQENVSKTLSISDLDNQYTLTGVLTSSMFRSVKGKYVYHFNGENESVKYRNDFELVANKLSGTFNPVNGETGANAYLPISGTFGTKISHTLINITPRRYYTSGDIPYWIRLNLLNSLDYTSVNSFIIIDKNDGDFKIEEKFFGTQPNWGF